MQKTREYQNLLNVHDFQNIKKDMLGTWFPWYFFPKSVPDETIKNPLSDSVFFQSSIFRHRFYDNYKVTSDWHKIVDVLVAKLSGVSGLPLKIKSSYANLLPANNVKRKTLDVPHVDRTEQNGRSLTGIFYLTNSNQGTTIFEKTENQEQKNCDGIAKIEQMKIKEIVNAEENKLILFDCRRYHSAPASCDDNRLVINLNIDILEQ
jgi:hypothetical protein